MHHRALEFIFIFLDNVLKGEQDLVKCAHTAYDNSLRKYHGWIVRGVFTVSREKWGDNCLIFASGGSKSCTILQRLYEEFEEK